MSASEETAAPRFKLIPFADVALDKSPPYLVKDLVPRDGLTVIWGQSGCGKSFWTFDLAMHIALGWEYRGRSVLKSPVVYIAAEGPRGIRARTEAWRRTRLEAYEHIVPFWEVLTAVDLIQEWPELVDSIHAGTGQVGPAAIVIDTLNRSLTGSESSDEDMGAYLKAAAQIRENFPAKDTHPGCSVILVHHCGHDKTRLRGHTSLEAAADAIIAVKRQSDGLICTEVTKMRDGAEGDKTASRLKVVEVGTDSDGDAITSCIVEPADDETPTPAAQRITGQARIALDLLRKAVVEEGQESPGGRHYPRGHFRVVPLDLWRRYCKTGGLTEGDSPEAFKKAFQRAREKLQTLGLIGIWNDLVWLVEGEGDKGT